MFEQTFKNIDDMLHKDAGCGSELDYVEQSKFFSKYLFHEYFTNGLKQKSQPLIIRWLRF